VLAQRTADLAISEAREEAARLSEEARTQSEQLMTQAQEAARRLRDDAEFEAHESLDHFAEQRERLEREVSALAALLSGERERLTTSLQSALHFVGETLTLSDEMSAVAATKRDPSSSPTKRDVRKSIDDVSELPDVEVEIAEDANTAFGSQAVAPETRHGIEDHTSGGETQALDPDEELWARWAQGAGLGEHDASAPHQSQREHDR
jgi:vacuolar-type H+-ATPase subunit H